MDKIFMLIILLIVGFWGYLKYSEDSGNWIATGNNGVIGEYSNYDDCVADVKFFLIAFCQISFCLLQLLVAI